MPKSRTAILATGATKLAVTVDDDSTIELSGTFGSVAMTGPSGLVGARTADTVAVVFGTVMTEMLFTLTGTGPVVVTVTPTRVGNISKFEETA